MMGRERAVIRWGVHYQMTLDELRRLEQSLATSNQEGSSAAAQQARIADLRARLRQLGPSPHARMG